MSDEKKLDNRYVVLREIGSGGFGAVYLAEDTRFTGKNRVAIKKMAQTNEQTKKTFHHEANLLYNLTHPNLPKVTNCFQENDANYIVMDYIAGEDLMQRLKNGTSFSIAESLEIAGKVLGALEYLHSFSIFHRDIKPHNIKIDDGGKIFLLDFGTAKGQVDDRTLALHEQQQQQSITGYTPTYAPLEQVLRVDANSYLLLKSIDSPNLSAFEHYKTDARGDIYSLGATLYHLLTNVAPDRATATLRAHLVWSGKADPLIDCRQYNPKISASLAAIVTKALEIDPNNRFQTAAEFRAALENTAIAKVSAENPPPVPLETQRVAANTEQNQNQVTQRSVEPVKINLQPSVPPLDSIQTLVNKNAVPPAKGKFAAIFAGAFLVIAAFAGLGGWLVWKNLNQTAENTNTQTADVSPNPPKTGSLTYSLLVQKMRGAAKFQEPFESSGQEIFETGYQFQMRLTPPANGFLYVFAEGLNDRGEKVFNINFPTPQRNNGSASVTANQKYESGWNEFRGKAGTENYWLFYAKEKSEIAEQAKENAYANAGTVADAEIRGKLKTFLEQAKNTRAQAVKDAEKKLSKIEYEGDSVVYLIGLEHR